MTLRRILTTLALALSMGFVLMAAGTEARAVNTVTTLSGLGTATIDGVLAAGEWDGAATLDIQVGLPEGGTAPGRLYVMNDSANLYFALHFARTAADPGNSLVFEFDNGGGFFTEGSDAIVHNPGAGFFDDFRTTQPPCPASLVCGFFDTDFGGTNDGAGAFANDGVHSIYEMSHPLDSADDAHDFSLSPGDHVSALSQVSLGSSTGGADTPLEAIDILIAGGIDDLVPCDGGWTNHGEYLARIVEESDRLRRAGLLSDAERAAIIARAAKSLCGK